MQNYHACKVQESLDVGYKKLLIIKIYLVLQKKLTHKNNIFQELLA